jgi:pilus assembly protein Flp/PilA
MLHNLYAMLRSDDGQGLIEYALVIALVAVVAIAALKLLGGKVNNTLNNAANQLGP